MKKRQLIAASLKKANEGGDGSAAKIVTDTYTEECADLY